VTVPGDSSPSVASANLFPLRLSDFEYYMLTDDRPSHPMVFVVVIHIRGSLRELPFRQSLNELVIAHPLLGCQVTRIAGKEWCWRPLDLSAEGFAEIVDWETVTEATVSEFVPEVIPLDIQKQPGIKVRVLAAENRAQVVMYLHHACCDGIGALHLIGELFARYGQRTAAPDAKRPEFEPPDPSLLLQRENYSDGQSSAQRQKKSLRTIAGKISRLLLRAPVVLAGSAQFSGTKTVARLSHTGRPTDPNSLAIQSRVLPRSLHKQLRAVAAQLGVSINDLFIREMTLQIRDWNRRASQPFGRRWIRLAIPLSMRTSVHDRMPAANVVSYALVTRREADCEDPQELLQSIHRQTSDVLFNREGIVCLKLFRVLRKIPHAMKMFLSFKTVLSTMVLANVGDVRRRFSGRFPLDKGHWVAGNVVLQQIHGVAPVRPNTRAAMSIGDYAGDLSVSLRTDGLVLNTEDSQRFLNEFLDRLQALAEHSNVLDSEDSVTE
jgi:NRPS condensation-like uncharacterized protein